MWQRLVEGIYMPHGYCLLWEPWLVALHAGSDLLTFGAYFAIPLAIWSFIRQRPNVELRGLAKLFAAFILWCGLTHLFSAITLWHPIYELQGLVKASTAAISVATAVLIFPLIPKALAIPSPNEFRLANAQLQKEIAAHEQTLAALQKARDELEERVELRTQDLVAARERFRALFEHAPVAMLLINEVGTVEQVNSAAEEVFASVRGNLIGLPQGQLLATADPESPTAVQEGRSGAGQEVTANRLNGERFPAELRINPLPGEGAKASVISVIDASERRRQADRMQFIMRELSHRTKNLLAVLQGMVRQAIATSPDLKTFERSFSDRLQGLAKSHDLLVGKNWQGTSMHDLVEAQLSFVKRDDQLIRVTGPAIVLSPEATQNIGLALHELATNAAKHGALHDGSGTLHVSWRLLTEPGYEPTVEFIWQEAGGNLTPSSRRGFGRTVLERVVPAALAGKAELNISASGAIWRLRAPLTMLTAKSLPGSAN